MCATHCVVASLFMTSILYCQCHQYRDHLSRVVADRHGSTVVDGDKRTGFERQEQWARARAHPEQISTQSQHAARCNWNQSGGKCVLFCQNMKYSFNLYSVRLIQTSLPRIQLTSKGTSKVPNGLWRDSFYKIKQKPGKSSVRTNDQ